MLPTEKAIQDVITAVINPGKRFTTAERLYPKGFAAIAKDLLRSEMQYPRAQPGAIGGTRGKRLRQLHHTQDSTEEELKSSVSEGNSRGNLGGLKATWYLARSNTSHYTIS